MKVRVLTTTRLSVCRWWEETCWQERGFAVGSVESGLICLPSCWLTGEGCQRDGPGSFRACLGRVCCGSVHGCVALGMPLGSYVHLCKSIHMSAPGHTAKLVLQTSPVLHLLLSSGSKKGLSCRASLLFAIIWQGCSLWGCRTEKTLHFDEASDGAGCRAPSR